MIERTYINGIISSGCNIGNSAFALWGQNHFVFDEGILVNDSIQITSGNVTSIFNIEWTEFPGSCAR